MKVAHSIVILNQADRHGSAWYEVWVVCDAHAKDDLQSIVVHTGNKRVIKREVENRLGIMVPFRKVRWVERKGLSHGRFSGPPSNRELVGYDTSPIFSILEFTHAG